MINVYIQLISVRSFCDDLGQGKKVVSAASSTPAIRCSLANFSSASAMENSSVNLHLVSAAIELALPALYRAPVKRVLDHIASLGFVNPRKQNYFVLASFKVQC